MKKRVFRILAVAFLWFCAALAASALEDIPVYGPARVAVEDSDLLAGTVLEVGVLAVTPEQPYRVVIGDGITPGGIPIHPEGCVTQFNQIANATTNLNMHSYSITFGPWAMSGGLDEWAMTWGGTETWLRLVRDTGIAYLSYDFTIIDPAHYRFELVWTGEGYDFPVLMVSTNLLQGYAAADPADVNYLRPDVSHLVVDYSVPGDYEFIGFRFFAPDRMKTGAYFGVPVHADYGLAAVGSLSVTGRVESYYDETAEENRDRYVPGSITIDGEEVATTGAVAAHSADTNAHPAAIENYLIAHGILADLYSGDPSSNDGVGRLAGWGNYLSFEENQWWHPVGTDFTYWSTNSTWVFRTPTRPRWRRDIGGQSEDFGLATTNDIAVHEARQDNPHGVTADQTGALPATKGPLETYLVGDDVIFDGGVSVEGGINVGGNLDVAQNVQAGSLTIGTGTTTNLSELATAASVSAVSDRVGELETNIAPWATEPWTFVLANGTTVTRSVVIASEED